MYLIYGDSFRLIEEEIAKIVKNENNIVTMDLLSCDLYDVLTEAQYVSMFQEKKYIIVKNANFFTANSKTSEEEIEAFMKYMKEPASLTTLIFTTYEKIDSRKKVVKTFSSLHKVISVHLLNTNDLLNKLRDYVFHNKYKIDTDTLHYIVTACQNNYDLAYNELNKLFLYYNEPQLIQLADVKQIVSRALMDNHFKFVEAVVEKDMKRALRILNDLYTLKVDPIQLIMLLAREYRLMYSALTLRECGYPKSKIGKELGLQDWQIDKLLRNCSLYYKDTLAGLLKQLSILDYKLKKGDMDRFMALKTFLLEIE